MGLFTKGMRAAFVSQLAKIAQRDIGGLASP